MSDRNRKNPAHSKKAKVQGSRPTSAHASGRNTPNLRSSRQPTVNPNLGDQIILDPSSNDERPFKRPRTTGQYSGDQSVREPPSSGQRALVSGQTINNGIYIITNEHHHRFVYLEDPNGNTPLRGHFRPGNRNALWHVRYYGNEQYSIENVEHNRYADPGNRAVVKAHVEGSDEEGLWRIQALASGEYTIATTDTGNLWMLPSDIADTPVELFKVYTDRRCWWTFTKPTRDGYAETSIVSETLARPLRRLPEDVGAIKLGHIEHPLVTKDELEKHNEELRRLVESARDIEDSQVLERLKPVDTAGYSEDRSCMEGTRTKLLDYLLKWSSKPSPPPNGSSAANMYWLYGSPGLGKTSIANSLCGRLHESKTLGGSFFCRRDDSILSDPRRVVPTLVAKLTGMSAHYKSLVAKALKDDPQLNPQSRRGEVLLSLLQSVEQIPPHPLVLVIDALDECGNPNTWRELLACLFEACSHVSWIKVIITSRPEYDIQRFFEQNQVDGRDLADDHQAPEDIRLFTRRLMASVASKHYLPLDWPGEERLNLIYEQSGGLFIYVETVSRLVDDPDPEPLLSKVLGAESGEANTELDKLYSTAILSRIGNNKMKFRLVAQAIVTAATYRPLPDQTLALLMGLECSVVRSWVDRLGAVLYPDASTNGGIRVRHLSVIDFLTSLACPEEFRVVLGQANEEMGVRCLVTMAKELKFNICELETSCVLNADIPDLNNRVQEKISDALVYSSMHWADHLCSDSVPASSAVSELLDAFLRGTQQLYWVEVLSLMGKTPVAISSMRRMKACFKKFEDRHQHLVGDTLRFLLAFFTPISTSTPHIYISALPFTPMESDVWKHASALFPETIDVCKGRNKSWPPPSSIWLGHTEYVQSIAYSPDGLNVVSGSEDCTIRIWDVETGAAVGQPLIGHTGTVSSVAYSPDGQSVVSGSEDNTIRIWDAQTGEAVGQPLTGHTDTIISVKYSPDGRNIVSASEDDTIRTWDARTGALVGQPLAGRTEDAGSVAYSPDGRNVVFASQDTIEIYDAHTGEPVGQPPPTGFPGGIYSVAYSPNGQKIIAGSYDCTIRIWDAQTGEAAGQPVGGHTGSILHVTYSPDGMNILSLCRDGVVRIRDAQTGIAGPPLFTGHPGKIYSIAYSPNGRNIITGSYGDNTIRIWDVQTGAAVGQPLTGHSGFAFSVAYSPDGQNIVSGSNGDNTIRIWDAQNRVVAGSPLRGHTGSIRSVAYSPNGRNVVSASMDKTIGIWDAQNGEAVAQPLTGHTEGVWSAAYSPDGQNIVSGSLDDTIRIWDSQTGEAVGQPLTGHTSGVWSVAYSPDGRNIVSGSMDNTIRIWDAQTGDAVGQPLTGHTHAVWSVSYSPDGQNVVSGPSDNMIRIWDAQNEVDEGRYRVVSHPSYPLTMHLSLTSLSGRSIPTTWLGPDGWVRDAEGLLFWVPEDCREGLTCPAILTIPNTGRQRTVRIDFTRFQYGTSWTDIRGGIRETYHSSVSSV